MIDAALKTARGDVDREHMHQYVRRAALVFVLALSSCGGTLELTSVAPTTSTSVTTATTPTEPGTASPNNASTTRSSSTIALTTTATSAPQSTRATTTTATSLALAAVRANLEVWVNEDSDFSKKDITCMVSGIMNALGEKRMLDLGLDDDPFAMEFSLTTGEARKVVDAMMACIDLRAVLLEDLESDEDLTATQRSCVRARLTNDAVRDLVMFGLTEVEFDSLAYEAVLACLS